MFPIWLREARLANHCILFSLTFIQCPNFFGLGVVTVCEFTLAVETSIFKVRKIIVLNIVLLLFGVTSERPLCCLCLLVFHVSDGVGVNAFLRPILHSERNVIVIQEVCSSLLGWGHYKAPPCISSQEASISFNWIDKWKDEWDSTSSLHCWVVSLVSVHSFVFLDASLWCWGDKPAFSFISACFRAGRGWCHLVGGTCGICISAVLMSPWWFPTCFPT